jgi:pilus assembly protein Flp/PilA
MKDLTSALRTFASDESGATAIEYALIASIISISIAAAATLLRGDLQGAYQKAADGLKNATN